MRCGVCRAPLTVRGHRIVEEMRGKRRVPIYHPCPRLNDPDAHPARVRKVEAEKGTSYVNGSCLGPAERDPSTGNIEQGPHITRRHAANGDIAVVAVDRSPMNAKRWCLTLSCGHEVWVTATRKPKPKTSKCEKCAAS